MTLLKNKCVLISGGTGSFGNAVLDKLIESEVHEIRIFSRDEKKQDDMRKKYNNERLQFCLGDVRDPSSIRRSMRNVDYVFHAAALKQVPSCEFYPMEAVKTNIIGTENILDEAISAGVKKVVCLSTDKAVYPINAMGISKALMEKIIIARARLSGSTDICITRYGNVMGSRGSVIPLFEKQINQGLPVSITDRNMTRFMMTLKEAVNLVLFAFQNGGSGDILVQKSPAATIEVLFNAVSKLKNLDEYPMKIIGTRHGEKQYETLLSKEEMVKAHDLGNYFRIPPDTRSLNYDAYFSKGTELPVSVDEYNSNNTNQLDVNQMVTLLHDM